MAGGKQGAKVKGMGSERKREGERKEAGRQCFPLIIPCLNKVDPHGTVCVLLVERRQQRAT